MVPEVVPEFVEVGRWHNPECLESGTAILECKDGKYEVLREEDNLVKA